MDLFEVQIIDFKSIKDLTISIEKSVLCLVGINECGKTSIIEAISYLNLLKQFDDLNLTNKLSEREGKYLPYIAGRFNLEKSEFEEAQDIFSEDYFKADFLQTINKNFRTSKSRIVLEIERWGNSSDEIEISLITEDKKNAVKLKEQLKDKRQYNKLLQDVSNRLLPEIEFYSNDELSLEPATIDDLKGSKKDHESMRRLLTLAKCTDYDIFKSKKVFQATEKYSLQISQLFKKYYLQDSNLSFKISYNDNKVSILVQEKIPGRDDEFFELSERSPGFQYFFAFIVNKHFLTRKNNRNQIFLLDEPGSNLHPKGARDLLKTFRSITNSSSQILYTTHNLFLVIRDDIDSILYIRKDNSNLGTYIQNKVYRNNFEVLRKELGVFLNDSFLVGDINIIVDGSTEKYALPRLFNYFSLEKNKFPFLEWMNIFSAEGTTEIKSAIRYINSLNLKGIVLFDSDDISRVIRKNEKVSEILNTSNWEEVTINDAFNNNANRVFEDLFPQQLYINAYNKFYHEMSSVIDFKTSFKDIKLESVKEIKTPIVDLLREHYLKHLYSGEEPKNRKETINKVGIMRYLLDDIFGLNEKDRREALKYVEKLFNLISNKTNKLLN